MKRVDAIQLSVELCVASACVAAVGLWIWMHPHSVERELFTQPQYVGIDYERLYAVSTAFRRVLERPPTESELHHYQIKLSIDPEFDVPALEVRLRQSAEYKRLVGIQKNSSFAEIGGVVSEQAIRGKLADMYQRITGQQPDRVTMDLLYSRYRHTNLSDAYITALIQQMADVSGSRSGETGGATSSSAKNAVSAAENGTSNGNLGQDASAITIEREWLRSLGFSDSELNGKPHEILAKLRTAAMACENGQADKDKKIRSALCTRERHRMLDSIGYDEGERMGSWTMPRNRDSVKFDRSRKDHRAVCASKDQTALVGTLLRDANRHGNLILA